jgi:hypothetical protein
VTPGALGALQVSLAVRPRRACTSTWTCRGLVGCGGSRLQQAETVTPAGAWGVSIASVLQRARQGVCALRGVGVHDGLAQPDGPLMSVWWELEMVFYRKDGVGVGNISSRLRTWIGDGFVDVLYVRILCGRSWAGSSSMTSRRQLDHGQAGHSCVITRYDRNLRKKLFAIWCLAASDHFEGLHYRNGFKAYLLIYLHTDI